MDYQITKSNIYKVLSYYLTAYSKIYLILIDTEPGARIKFTLGGKKKKKTFSKITFCPEHTKIYNFFLSTQLTLRFPKTGLDRTFSVKILAVFYKNR